MPSAASPGTLYLVATPIGNLDDISKRAVDILSSVDFIAAEDTRVTRTLLDHFGIQKPMLSYHNYNERERAPEIVKRLTAGSSVAIVTDAGTPGISDPAFYIVREALADGIRVVPIPGPTALIAALIVSGLPTDRFVFEGFLPQKKGRRKKIDALLAEDRTVVVYESPYRVQKFMAELKERAPDRHVAVCRELTKKFEEIIRGTAAEAAERIRSKEPRGEYVVVIAGTGKGARSAHAEEEEDEG